MYPAMTLMPHKGKERKGNRETCDATWLPPDCRPPQVTCADRCNFTPAHKLSPVPAPSSPPLLTRITRPSLPSPFCFNKKKSVYPVLTSFASSPTKKTPHIPQNPCMGPADTTSSICVEGQEQLSVAATSRTAYKQQQPSYACGRHHVVDRWTGNIACTGLLQVICRTGDVKQGVDAIVLCSPHVQLTLGSMCKSALHGSGSTRPPLPRT